MVKGSPRAAVLDYMDYSTVHGVSRVRNSPYIVLKCVWMLLVIGSLAMISLQVSRLYDKWRSQPVSTTVTLETPDTLTFPGVTVCNINPLRYSGVKVDDPLLNLVAMASDDFGIPLSVFEPDGSNVTVDLSSATPILSANDDVLASLGSAFKMRMGTLQDSMMKGLSQPAEDFIIHCQYAKSHCSSANFTSTRSYDFGMCYTFKPQFDGVELFDVSAAGADYGLELILNVEEHEHVPFVTTSSGVAVALHDPSKSVSPKQDDYQFPTGFQTSLSVSLTETKRVKQAKSPCDDSEVFHGVKECLAACLEQEIERICNCSRRPWSESYTGDGDSDSANSANSAGYRTLDEDCTNALDFSCIQDIEEGIVNGLATACSDCRVPCRQKTYKATASQTRWPGSRFVPMLSAMLNSSALRNMSSYEREYYITGNLLFLRVFLSSMTFEKIEEELSYSNENFVSDIGGQLGLWAGFSVLSICELVELVILVLDKLRRGAKRDSDVTPLEQGPEKGDA